MMGTAREGMLMVRDRDVREVVIVAMGVVVIVVGVVVMVVTVVVVVRRDVQKEEKGRAKAGKEKRTARQRFKCPVTTTTTAAAEATTPSPPSVVHLPPPKSWFTPQTVKNRTVHKNHVIVDLSTTVFAYDALFSSLLTVQIYASTVQKQVAKLAEERCKIRHSYAVLIV